MKEENKVNDNLELTPVTSSNIAAVGYIDSEEALVVEFKYGAIYKYLDVPYFKYEELLSADSAGKYLNAEIKGSHEFVQL